ncbi:MAG: 16S rRNA (guanine(527)-N(7))-methyltransferase RsmG [Bacteroidales bacterium]|jgi:16S rRNA (guanine527-N7)-methyltransferase|nr:16S rRNA (guanine(527)-N(7))-methyltransferase RsmG [Bacteroidales bacterium]
MGLLISKYFPELTEKQYRQFAMLPELYADWNEKINVVSRKDIENITEKHILHSLAIAKVIGFDAGTRILDVGTGGGFPGIPLAIMFPDCEFCLVDSIAKKIKVVSEVSTAVGLTNVTAQQARAETLNRQYDFVVSRAVTAFPEFLNWVKKNISKQNHNKLPNGILYLKGGDLSQELLGFEHQIKIFDIQNYFEEPFFETKKVVYFSKMNENCQL